MSEYEKEALEFKKKFEDAFYGLLNAGKQVEELTAKVEYAGKLIQLNQAKQHQIKQMIEVIK